MKLLTSEGNIFDGTVEEIFDLLGRLKATATPNLSLPAPVNTPKEKRVVKHSEAFEIHRADERKRQL